MKPSVQSMINICYEETVIVLNRRWNVRRKEREEVNDNPAFWLAARSKPRRHVLDVCCILDTLPQRNTHFVSLATLKLNWSSVSWCLDKQSHSAEFHLQDQMCGNTRVMKVIMRLVWSHTSSKRRHTLCLSDPDIYLLIRYWGRKWDRCVPNKENEVLHLSVKDDSGFYQATEQEEIKSSVKVS